MKININELTDRAISSWKTTSLGASEGALFGALGVASTDPNVQKIAFLLGAFKFIKGLFSKDAGK